jgi:hypothetical protein
MAYYETGTIPPGGLDCRALVGFATHVGTADGQGAVSPHRREAFGQAHLDKL